MNVKNDDSYLPVMEEAAKAGVNSFLLNVNWERIYGSRGEQANWSQIDKEVALAARLGCKVMLRIWIARHNDGYGGWWPESSRPVGNGGLRRSILGGITFSDESAIQESLAFVQEVAEHFKARQQAGEIALISIANTEACEIGYTLEGFSPEHGKDILQVYDYTDHTIRAFKDWMKRKYISIDNVNKAWNSDYSRFEDVYPPRPRNEELWNAFAFTAGRDWYLFRHHALKGFMDRVVETVKGVDNSYKFVQDMGSCWDGLSANRGTLGFKDLCAKSDGLKINDLNEYPHRFSMDLLRTNLPGKMIGNEVGGIPPNSYPNDWKKQIDQSFEHGADWVNLFAFDELWQLSPALGVITEMSQKWLNVPVPAIFPEQTVTYTLSEAVKQGTNGVRDRWRAAYNISQKPIRVVLEEDWLGELPVVNKPPKLVTAIPNQQGSVGKWFQYTIPKDNFQDEDGIITGVETQGMPEGIYLNGWNLEGRPLKTGDFTVTARVSDNAGAMVSTTFKVTVVSSTDANLISLYAAGNFLTRRFLRYIQDGDTLRGPDVQQTVNLMASPRTGSIGSYSFALSGPYSVSSVDSRTPYGLFGDNGGVALVPGTYTFLIRSFSSADMQGTLISQQTVRFVVVEGQDTTNQPPFLYKQPKGLLAKVGDPFEYRLPDSTYVDPDGTIASISMTGLPDGLTSTGSLIKGTPSRKGDFNVQLKATDDQGASSSTQFVFTVTADNQPPVVKASIPDLTITINQPFEYRIPDTTFVDMDGTIVSYAILGTLPAGLVASGRLLSGVPKAAGQYQLAAVATDNGNASAQVAFKLIVIDATNASPVLSKALVNLSTKVGEAFEYRLPDATFTDPDGTIASITMNALPDGLVWDGTLIKGTAQRKGTFEVQVTAVDNKGASIAAKFTITVTIDNVAPIAVKTIPDLTTEVGKSFNYQLPEGTFVDTDGVIAGITIEGAPQGLSANKDVVSGAPAVTGVFQLKAIATDDAGATAQITFKLTVTAAVENHPPFVASQIPDQQALKGESFTYTIPGNTFVDSDGTVAKIEISGLPAGLTATGLTISGVPADSGSYTISVTAIDDKGASAKTTFKLRVNIVNTAPNLLMDLPELVAIVGQVFSFDVKEYFEDKDGKIESISYASALPPGLTASESRLSGNPTAAGRYEIKVRVKDNKGATTENTLKLRVEKPELSIDLYQAGNEVTRKFLRQIANADIIDGSALPQLLNIFVSSNARITSVTFELTGSVTAKYTDDKPPFFSLLGEEEGFPPVTGTYQLKATAYRDGALVVSRTIRFDIIKGVSSTGRQGVEETAPEQVEAAAFVPDFITDPWKAYPNPFQDRVQLQTGGKSQSTVNRVEVLSIDGRPLPLATHHWKLNGGVLEVDLSEVATAPGMYLMRIQDSTGQQRTIKLIKSDQR
ncbi:putative Ig domain-containing protein [Telluribacter sp.]|uniref:putative Ig domain-containing protein n=1 Tax=Telluribacter sp. TaxID=1978767 RepID=UPI002E101FAE|nr:putative Ig domain-containing protein [Telluribacter sp.]